MTKQIKVTCSCGNPVCAKDMKIKKYVKFLLRKKREFNISDDDLADLIDEAYLEALLDCAEK